MLFAGSGLVLALVGSFLPWVISGQVRRSSYAVAGMIDRLGVAGNGVLGALAAGWPLVGLLCSAPVIAAVLRRWGTAGALCIILGLTMAAVSIAMLVFSGQGAIGVRVDPIGPSVTVAGATLLTVGGMVLFSTSIGHKHRSQGPNG